MDASTCISPDDCTTQTPQQVLPIAERTNEALLKIIRDNFNTQYATQAPSLTAFRDAVSAHDGIDTDATLLAGFRTHVPLSNYTWYKPFVDRFDRQPCKKEEVENLLAPGLPDFLACSGATSTSTPKLLPKYDHYPTPPRCPFFDSDSKAPLAAVQYFGYTDVREIEHAGQVTQRIPVCIVTSGILRKCLGWEFDEDKSRMSLAMPFYAAPLAATFIHHVPSFLTIHGLFFLTYRNIDRLYTPFGPVFLDLVNHIDRQWDMLVSCIREGSIPNLEGISHVREFLQAHLRADPERAAELLEIGPPHALEGWAARVWPKARGLYTICSGPFATALPKIRSILGPSIPAHSTMYGSSEAAIGISRDMNKPDEFVPWSEDVLEFLDISQDESHKNVCQVWEVEVGKQYEPILTTKDGLWRYQLGDMLAIIGFTPDRNPIFKIMGRRSLSISLPHARILDVHLLEAISASGSEDTMRVQEFTTVLDDRTLPPTVGFFVELTGPLGPNAHLAPQKLFDALVAIDAQHERARQLGQIRLPTIRVVSAGTFAEYRHRKTVRASIGFGQIKVPLVLVNPSAEDWILARVTQEL